jgi:hypothetical protein
MTRTNPVTPDRARATLLSEHGRRERGQMDVNDLKRAWSVIFVGALCAGIASYFLVAATSYPRSTGYLDASCRSSGNGFPHTYQFKSGKNRRDEVCCDAAVYVSPFGHESDGFAVELKRRNCMRVMGGALFGKNYWELSTVCPEYYFQMERFAKAVDLNGTVIFACKYNPDKRSSPFEVCISDSFSCDTVTLAEYKELQNYDQRQTQLVPLFIFLILFGVALIVVVGCIYVRKWFASQSASREFSKFDADNHEKSRSSALA